MPTKIDLGVEIDHIDSLTRSNGISAIIELIWNALDADATLINIECEKNKLGRIERLVIQDNGHGLDYQKAQYVFDHYGVDCFAEDTGLEIDALNGAPGVDTAHYAGPERDPIANINLVLQQLAGRDDRSARFRTVIALILKGELHTFEGVAEGRIANSRSGEDGFGYDPIFIPDGHEQTFAELSSEIKNAISHRGRAMQKLKAFLMK